MVGGADKAAKTVNKKNVGHFKAQLEKAKAEKMELDRVSSLCLSKSSVVSAVVGLKRHVVGVSVGVPNAVRYLGGR